MAWLGEKQWKRRGVFLCEEEQLEGEEVLVEVGSMGPSVGAWHDFSA